MNFDNWGGDSKPPSSPKSEPGFQQQSSNNKKSSLAEHEEEPSSHHHHHHDILSRVYPEDGRLVGTDAIFTSSPNVIPHHCSDVDSNPHKRMGIPTPSVYTDDRGEIHNIKAHDKRINILYTKKGYLRSGDLHPNTQCDFIFSGRVNIWTLESDGRTKITTFGAHDFITVPRGVPHVFEFVEDTVLAEWWEPPGFQAWFYKPYRDIVNKKMEGSSGSGEGEGSDNGRGGRKKKGLEILVPAGNTNWNTTKLVLGVAFVGCLGFAIGRRSR